MIVEPPWNQRPRVRPRSRAAFEPFEIQNPLPPQAVSPDGEVYVRLVGQNEFGDNPMSPNDLSLVWEAS